MRPSGFRRAIAFALSIVFLLGISRSADAQSGAADWSGLYIGGSSGAWLSERSVSVLTTASSDNGLPALESHGIPSAQSATGTFKAGNDVGFIWGGQIGWNWQSQNWVFGVEADLHRMVGKKDGEGFGSGVVGPFSSVAGTIDRTTFAISNELDYLGTVRGRIGWLWTPEVLVFATGGLAYGKASSSVSYVTTNPAYPTAFLSPTWSSAGSFSDTRFGWTIGGGAEWKLNRNWTASASYLFYDLGDARYALPVTGSVVLPAGSRWFSQTSDVSTQFSGSIIRFGVNYLFN